MKNLGFGLMRLPYQDNKEWGNVDLEKTQQMIDFFIQNNFSYFDTAWVYHGGNSEKILGKLVASRYPREKFQVATKMPLWDVNSPDKLDEIFNKQLENCNVSYFDVYLIHAVNKDIYQKSEELNVFDFILQKKKEGKIKNIGFSFHDNAELLDKILSNHPEIDVVQLQINYIDWESDDVQARKCYEIAAIKHQKKIIVMEPLKGGNLANLTLEVQNVLKQENPNASIASWAIRYAASLDKVFMVLSGMSNMEQIEDNVSFMNEFVPLNTNEKSIINKITDTIKKLTLVPCTGCNYCVDGCPKKINIPQYFKLYNDQNRYGLVGGLTWNYNETKKNGGSPSDCIKCNKCENHCPQKINITEQLLNVTKVFER